VQPSVVNTPPSLSRPPLPSQLVVDTHHETEIRHPFSLETGRCACRVRVYTRAEGVTVLISEQPGELDITDTYAIEQLASELLPAITTPNRIDTITWIAQALPLNHSRAHNGFVLEDRFFEILFHKFLDDQKYLCEKTSYGVFARSTWKCISRDHVEALVGEPVGKLASA
jgi:hypothetical protein